MNLRNRNLLLIAALSSLLAGPATHAADSAANSSEHSAATLRERVTARGPIEALHVSGTRWVVINQLSSSASLVDLESAQVIEEVRLGDHPQDIAAIPSPRGSAGSKRFAVTCRDAGV
ncbi:MAG TPA: hypothetical protein DDW52_08410, partial [Planctomycetaceae bacterium]|nr:hypothetical protein [Planctomycetaceae bacterium]